MKKLIPALCLLLISAILMGTSTYAWFSMNRTVEATNMSIKATTDASLVITDRADKTFESGKVSVNEAAIDVTVMPATKFANGKESSDGVALSSSATDLMYVNNGGNIDPTTGLARKVSGVALPLYYSAATTASVTGGSTIGYYYDFVFYLAAEGNADIAAGALKLTVPAAVLPTTPGSGTEKILAATSVLVYVNDDIVDIAPIRIKDGVSKVTLTTLSDSNKIVKGAPGTVSGAMKITLRVYVDGALEDETDVSTYVRNNAIVSLSRAISFDAKFEIE